MEIFLLLTFAMFAWLVYVQARAIVREKRYRKVIVALPSLAMAWVITDLVMNQSNLWPFAILVWTSIALFTHVIIVGVLSRPVEGKKVFHSSEENK